MTHPAPPDLRPRRRRFGRWLTLTASALALAAVAAGVGCAGQAPLAPRPPMLTAPEDLRLSVAALPLPTDAAPPPGVGPVLALSANDRRFGGWSGLSIAPAADGLRLTAISDRGYWVQGTLSDDRTTLTAPRLGRLEGLDGPLLASEDRDAEELLPLPDGGWLVSFERHHRLWRYPPSDPPFSRPPTPLPPPPGLEQAPYNAGIEALALLPDGRLLAVEEGDGGAAWTPVHIGTLNGDWQGHFILPLEDDMHPTALAVAGGHLLVLERRFSLLGGFAARLRDLGAPPSAPGATLGGPPRLTLDRPPLAENFEGLAVVPPGMRGDGNLRMFLLSDDNFSGLQRTVLLEFVPPS